MTRKHYAKIADLLNVMSDKYKENAEARRVIFSVAVMLSDLFADDNPRFDRERWWAACKVYLKEGEDLI